MLKTTEQHLNTVERQQLENFGAKINKFGVNFAVCNAQTEPVILCQADRFTTDIELLKKAVDSWSSHNTLSAETNQKYHLYHCPDGSQLLGASLKCSSGLVATAVVDIGKVDINCELLGEMLTLIAENFRSDDSNRDQIGMVSMELAQVYEELVLLHKLSTNMKVTESDFNYLQMACDNLTEIVSVEGIAILLEKSETENKDMVLMAGCGLIDIDECMAAITLTRLKDKLASGRDALLDSKVDAPLKYQWNDNIDNIIAVPLCSKGKPTTETDHSVYNEDNITGIMIAVNRIGKPDFDSIDVKLFNSVANSCAVFVENGNLFRELKELLIGSLKSLTSSIDAKDPYTRGHSERVALICKWIADKLADEQQLSQEQVHKIYLSGVLHDIGKIGVNEAILRKEGKLTKEEFDHIKQHPTIGAAILSGIKQMSDIVPGVLYHHERIDGKGYPNGLKGDRIPLIGKIVCLADSFDAMTSKRTYRNAMTVQQALVEVESQLGLQFDEKVGRIFLESDVYYLWEIMQNGLGKNYNHGNFSECGITAVGALLK